MEKHPQLRSRAEVQLTTALAAYHSKSQKPSKTITVAPPLPKNNSLHEHSAVRSQSLSQSTISTLSLRERVRLERSLNQEEIEEGISSSPRCLY